MSQLFCIMAGQLAAVGLSLLTWLLVQLVPASAVHAANLTSSERQFLDEKKTITFVSQSNYPPFEFTDLDRQHEGMMLDVVRWMAVEYGFQPSFLNMTFQQAQEAVLEGRADVLTSLFFSKKRSERFAFTEPLYAVPASIFIKAERTDIQGIRDLQQKTIAIQKGDYAREFLENKQITFHRIDTEDFATATDSVISGRADAVIGDEQIVLYHIFRNRLSDKIKKMGEPLYVGQNCMAASHDNALLIGILNKAIAEARAKGVLEKISKKWLGERFTGQPPLLQRLLWPILLGLGGLLILLLVVWLHNLRLRTLVRQKTASLARSEQELRESESNFRSFFSSMSDMIFVGGADGRIFHTNPAVIAKLGYSPEELRGKHLLGLHPPDKPAEAEEIFAAMFRGELDICPLPLQSKTGQQIPVETRAWPGHWNGEPCMFGVSKDLSKEQEALQKFNRFFHNSPVMMAVSRLPERVFTDVNESFLTTMGYCREEVIGRTALQLGLFTEPERQRQVAEAVQREGRFRNFELLVRTKDGRTLNGIFSGETIENQGQRYLLTVMVDQTKRQQAEVERAAALKSLRDSEQRYRSLVEKASDWVFRLGLDGYFTLVNPAMLEALGYSRGELLQHHYATVLHPDYRQQVRRFYARQLIHKEMNTYHRFPVLGKDGREFWLALNTQLITGDSGEVTGFQAVARDITERKRAEEASAYQQWRLQSIIDGTSCGTWEWNIVTGEVLHNEHWAAMLGCTLAELTPYTIDTWRQLAHPDDLQQAEELLKRHLDGEIPFFETELRMRHKDGHWVWMFERGQVVTWGGTEGNPQLMFGIDLDISARKQQEEERLLLERQLHQARKSESLGRMAGATAHHFNNLLSVVIGNLEMAMDGLRRDSEEYQFLNSALHSSMRATDLSRLMLTYIGQSIKKPVPCDISAQVQKTLSLLESTVPEGIRLESRLAAALPAITIDIPSFHQVVVNLLTNAWEAMSEQPGTISISTGCRLFAAADGKGMAASQPMPAGPYVYLEIRDSGSGMDQDTLNLIFDPFFSTKFPGRGLGLPAVAGIVRAAQGTVLVDSQPERGTVVWVLFPLSQAAATTAEPAPMESDQSPALPVSGNRQQPLLLLAEDEEAVRLMASAMLERLGYRVLTARDGAEAVSLFAQYQELVAAVILDLTMPHLDGWQALQEIRQRQPGVPAIIVSGHAENKVQRPELPEQPQIFLSKPYRREELRQALLVVLADSAATRVP